MLISHQISSRKRRGIILLVVLAMLTLLTMLGVTFVLYSDASESTAAINMASERNGAALSSIEINPSELMMYAFGQLIYDVEDPSKGDPVAGSASGLRGHGLARDIYGYLYSLNPRSNKPEPPCFRDASGDLITFTGVAPAFVPVESIGNDRPFRGTGRMQYGITNPETGAPANDRDFINYTAFSKTTGGVSAPALVRDPERYLPKANLTDPPNPYFGGANPPYTMPDMNHIALAKLDDNGRVVEPSFFRREAFGSSLDPNVPPLGSYTGTNWDFTSLPHWNTDEGKYRLIRPRKKEHKFFPDPSDGWGDVRNLPWGDRNDSIWIDLGVEPKTAPNGKKYKPLFAFLCTELDGRINLNAHGNIHGRDGAGGWNYLTARHASGQGWGAWEVSVQRALSTNPMMANDPTSPQWRNVFGASNKAGRFGIFNSATNTFNPYGYYDIPGGNAPHVYAPVNYNASSEPPGVGGLLDKPLLLPGSAVNLAFSPFGFGDSSFFGMGSPAERSMNGTTADPNRIHGALYHPYRSILTVDATSQPLINHRFPDKEMGLYLARELRNPTKYTTSELIQLGIFSSAPFAPLASRDRRYDRVTTMSWDYDKPGLMAYFTDLTNQALVMAPDAAVPPGSPPVPMYPNSGASPAPVYPANPSSFAGLVSNSDFDPYGRANSRVSLKGRLNLNRGLTSYPAIQATGTYLPSDLPLVQKANAERQTFATDILTHLVKATGAADPSDANLAATVFVAGGPPGGPDQQRYLATRWLAQLAVNMVDNLDADDVMTPFAWNPNDKANILFGHELSKLAINEVYAQVENDPNEIGVMVTTSPTKFNVKLYAELLNPLPADPNFDHRAVLQRGAQIVHKLEIYKSSIFDRANPSTNPLNPQNSNGIVGDLNPPGDLWASPFSGSSNWGGDLSISPSNNAFIANSGQGTMNGFLMVGAQPNDMNGASGITNSRWTTSNGLDTVHADLKFELKNGTGTGNESAIQALTGLARSQCPVLVLRRLANPGIPADNNPGTALAPNPNYNPYITIDLVDITPDMLASNDARKKIQKPSMVAENMDNPSFRTVDQRKSFGRQQPFRYIPKDFGGGANNGSLAAQDPVEFASSPPTDQPKTTMWRQNSRNNSPPIMTFLAPGSDTLETPFPRVHLDRIVTSPTELMATPFCRPHEYLLLNDNQFSYCKPWFDSGSRLHRFIEFAQAGDIRSLQYSRAIPGRSSVNDIDSVGAVGGRVSGKVNLNTVSREAFYALCDAQPGNRFNDAQIDAVYRQIVSMRPFLGNASGMTTGGDPVLAGAARGINQTIFGNLPAPADPGDNFRLAFDPLHSQYNGGMYVGTNAQGLPVNGMSRGQEFHPSVRLELLNKIAGRTTSRSNCFAVWLTVGFFEVVSESGRSDAFAPKVILGKELQPVQRRKFFSLVDRTQLECWRVSPDISMSLRPENIVTPPAGGEAIVPISQFKTVSGGIPTDLLPSSGITNPKTAKVYPISFGTVLTFDPDSDFGLEETVEVENIAPPGMAPTMGVRLRKNHGGMYGNITVVNRGNPGPVRDYKVEEDTKVVPFFAVLE